MSARGVDCAALREARRRALATSPTALALVVLLGACGDDAAPSSVPSGGAAGSAGVAGAGAGGASAATGGVAGASGSVSGAAGSAAGAGGVAAGSAGAAGKPTTTPAARAQQAASSDPACAAIAPFYWEVGTASGLVASGSAGDGSVVATTEMGIASASKLVFGAYVVERFKATPATIDQDALRMRSGYTSLDFSSCLSTLTVQACLDKGQNGGLSPAEVGKFHYDGGHFQHYAATSLGLGNLGNVKLAAELANVLGADVPFAFSSPQLAGGVRTSSVVYATFLRKIVAGSLAIREYLGKDAVCTLPAACPDEATYSPAAPYPWSYGYGHWTETDAGGAFSSPGAFGYYPWIDATKTTYGLVARQVVGAGAYLESTICGQKIRQAFLEPSP